jgi:ABC-type polysaccharide/polyol phosphate transport system ATPase subunit
VGSLLSIEAGLLSLLTGRENALLLGVLGGLSRKASKRALDSVKERSGLGDAFEYPVSAYSQGMRARLGFAVAEEAEPRILLLDEVHEALDHEFRTIVAERARELVDAGGIVVATGHDHPLLERLCSRAIYLDKGSISADGPFTTVQSIYLEHVEAGMHA